MSAEVVIAGDRGTRRLRRSLTCADQVRALPGAHSRWVRLEDGAVADSKTSVSGKLFPRLRDHNVPGRGPEVRSRRLRAELSPEAARVPDLPVTGVGAPGRTAGYAQALERLGRSVQCIEGDTAALTGLQHLRRALDHRGESGR